MNPRLSRHQDRGGHSPPTPPVFRGRGHPRRLGIVGMVVGVAASALIAI